MNIFILNGRSRVCKNKNIEKKCYISDEKRKNSDISRFLSL